MFIVGKVAIACSKFGDQTCINDGVHLLFKYALIDVHDVCWPYLQSSKGNKEILLLSKLTAIHRSEWKNLTRKEFI